MNTIIKLTLFLWLFVTGMASWITLNIMSYIFLVSINASFLAPVTWLMSVTSGTVLIIAAVKALNLKSLSTKESDKQAHS